MGTVENAEPRADGAARAETLRGYCNNRRGILARRSQRDVDFRAAAGVPDLKFRLNDGLSGRRSVSSAPLGPTTNT